MWRRERGKSNSRAAGVFDFGSYRPIRKRIEPLTVAVSVFPV